MGFGFDGTSIPAGEGFVGGGFRSVVRLSGSDLGFEGGGSFLSLSCLCGSSSLIK